MEEQRVLCQMCREELDDPDLTTYHRECGLREVLGGIGHAIAHEYWCNQRHDPDAGYTYRQSALMVYAIFHVNPGLLLQEPAQYSANSPDDPHPR